MAKKKRNTQDQKLQTVLFHGKLEMVPSQDGEVQFMDVKFTPSPDFIDDLEIISMTIYNGKTVMDFVSIVFSDIQILLNFKGWH